MSERRLLWKGAMTSRAMAIVLVVLVAVLTAVTSAAPLLLDRARTQTIQRAVADVAPASRDLGTTLAGVAGDTSADPWGASDRALAVIEQTLPDGVTAVLGSVRAQTKMELGKTRRATPYPANQLSLLADPDVLDTVTITDGRAPEAVTAPDEWEVVLAETAADDLDWPVGERRSVDADNAGTPGAWVTLVGVWEPKDAAEPDWAHTSGVLAATLATDGDAMVSAATGLVAPGEISRFTGGVTAVWWPIVPSKITAQNAPALTQDLRRIGALALTYPWIQVNVQESGIAFSSSSSVAIDAGIARGEATVAALATVVAGPLVVAVVVLALGSRLIARRRASAVRLMLARGAARSWIFRTLGAEGAVAGLLGGAVGLAASTAAVGWGGVFGVAVALVFALVPAIVTPLSALGMASAHARADLGSGGTASRRRRIALETVVFVLAVAVIALALSRTETVAGFDVILTVTPLAVAALATLGALRILPLVLRAAEAVGVSRAGLVPLLGPARARRDAPVRTAPVLAVIVGIAVTMFAAVFSATVTAGIRAQAVAETGADIHVSAAYISDDQVTAVAAIPGVRAVSLMSAGTPVRLEGVGAARVWVYGVDAESYADVQATRDDLGIDVSALVGASRGDTVPVIASDAVIDVLGGADDITTDRRVDLDVVAQTSAPSPFVNVERFVLVNRDDFTALTRTGFTGGELFVALEPGADVGAVRAALGEQIDAQRIADPATLLTERSTDPVFLAVTQGVIASAVMVAVLLGLAVVMTLMLGATGRGRVLALLRTLGYRRRGELALVTWEVAPALLVALPFGVLAGIATGVLVPRALDLTGFVHGTRQPAVQWDVGTLGLVVAAFVALAAVVVVIATLVASRMDSAVAVRSVDEEGR